MYLLVVKSVINEWILRLQEGELLEDFDSCECGGKLKF